MQTKTSVPKKDINLYKPIFEMIMVAKKQIMLRNNIKIKDNIKKESTNRDVAKR